MVSGSDELDRQQRQSMPNFVRTALERQKLMDAYRACSLEQQRDYIWWISSAKRRATQERRLNHMLNDLRKTQHADDLD
ncbi:YdeI/OmpD-associated family protein [Methylonatrum kenyense]|uniref:YdeI/OmpD-associated family protein n=1 Tax=Methylonatrum kenyense TaxID=455253 RepID=UPI0020BD7FCB|nr:YdeI/OmpD-associated family protein [Methylonatrum kenyense]MCK8516049.1 YdeI/OmpD-associated family protein [Methylonatrum kenyense]